MPTSKHALPFPAAGLKAANNPPLDIKALAEATDAAIPLSKRANQVVTTNGSGQATISFGMSFPDPPVVSATGGNGENIAIVSVSATGFVASFRSQANNGLILTGSVRILYIAMEAN
jgi:hypothetical protein